MRVCTKCNRMLRDDETSCPYCGCAIITDEPDLTPTAAQGNPRTPDLFATTIIELPKNLGKAPVEDSEPDEVLEDNFEFPKAPLDANGELMSNAAPAPVREGALLEQLVDEIEQSVRNSMENEVTTKTLGEMVMEKLRVLDEVAYVRFASVYRQFKDVNTFFEELHKLIKKRSDKNDKPEG